MKEKNVVNLVEYIENNQKIEAVNNTHEIPITKFEPESFVMKRIVALGIDFSAVFMIFLLCLSAYGVFLDKYLIPFNDQLKTNLLFTNMTFALSILLPIYFGYFAFTNIILNGKTIGKLIMKLTIINDAFIYNYENTHTLNIKQSFQRAFGYLLCYFSFGTFFVFNFASEDNRGLADYLSSTRTVSDDWLSSMLEHKEYELEHVVIDIDSLDKAA